MSNSGDTRFFEQMRDISQTGDARTREVGYHAMRFMESAESHAFFLESIQMRPPQKHLMCLARRSLVRIRRATRRTDSECRATTARRAQCRYSRLSY